MVFPKGSLVALGGEGGRADSTFRDRNHQVLTLCGTDQCIFNHLSLRDNCQQHSSS